VTPRFGLSTHLFHGERLERRHLETITAHGFDLIELFATRTHLDYHDDAAIDTLAAALAATGVTAGSMHAPICEGFRHGVWGRAFSNASPDAAARTEAVAETVAAMDAAVRLGCRTIVLHLGLPRGQTIPPGDNNAAAARRSAEALAEAAAARGLRLALEVIPNDLSTPGALRTMIDELEAAGAGICLDFGHAHMLGGAPEAIEALSGDIIATHVHDNRGVEDTHLVPFSGTIDWPASLMARWKVGYEGPLVFEIADHGDAADVLRRTVGARARLQAILEDLAQPFDFREQP
jgi:sugar phosphate isomerase/epimerase